ncbi:MAG: nitroreductase family protein [Bdellovibrionales bacterium]|jgi:nitroreductase|nr:nitroreductase family protein [Bdellovibrionales bacterium]
MTERAAPVSKSNLNEFSSEFRDEFYRLLKARRSIRKFKKDVPIPEEVLSRVLEAAIEAPSGKNRQNWRFFILRGQKRDEYVTLAQKSWLGIKDVLEKRLKPSLYAFTERFFFTLGDAPVVVLCYSHNDAEERYHTSIGSVYMAVENLNLACVAEGLGCCTMGAPLEIKEEIDRFLGVDQLPEYKAGELELLCAVVMGWPDHEPPKAARQIEGRFTNL